MTQSLIEQWSFYTCTYTHTGSLVGWFPCCWLQLEMNPPRTWLCNLMWWFFPLYQRKKMLFGYQGISRRVWNCTIARSKLWHEHAQTDTDTHTPTLLSILPRGSFLLSSYSRLTTFLGCYLNTTQAAWSSPSLGHCGHFSRQLRANVAQLVGQI